MGLFDSIGKLAGGLVGGLFGGGDDAPDPYQTANAQGQANTAAARTTTALNRANQYTPWGSQVWEDQGGDRWSSTINLSPEQQKLLDQQTQISLGLGGSQLSALNRVTDTFGQPVSTEGMTDRLDPYKAYGLATRDRVSLRPTAETAQVASNRALDIAGGAADNLEGQLATPLPAVRRVGNVPLYQGVAGQAPTSNEAYRKSVEDALYERASSRLDPRFAQATSDQEARLAAQGITQGSEAYNREVGNLGRERTDAYRQAVLDAIAGGETAITGQFGRDLAGRQQNVSERQADFTNALASRGQDLASENQYFAQELARRGQGLQEYGTAGSLALQAQRSAADTSLAERQNELISTQIARGYEDLTSDQRNQQLAELLQLRGLNLNELNALRSGAQVQTPQFGSTQSGTSVSAAPVAQSVWNSYNGDQAQQAQQMNTLLSAGQLGLTAFMFSDRRLKSSIRRLGTHPKGFGIYSYDIFGKPQVGVMADEIEKLIPEAVHTHPSGFKMVNYSML